MTRGRKRTAYTESGKLCARCHTDKPLTEYYKRRDAESSYCKRCDVERTLDKLSTEEIKTRISTHRQAILNLVAYLQKREA